MMIFRSSMVGSEHLKRKEEPLVPLSFSSALTPFVALIFLASPLQAGTLDVHQVLARVLNYHPSLKIAMLELQSAQHEGKRVRSRLGWQLGAAAGVRHDVSFFGSPNDVLDLNTQLTRQLATGETVSLSASLAYNRADVSLIPGFPNPYTDTRLDLSYRIPLQKGKGNLPYQQAVADSGRGVDVQQTNLMMQADRLAWQLVDLYYALASNEMRLSNGRQSIKRAQRLMDYINERSQLGVAEGKDQLQVQAQLKSLYAQQQILKSQVRQQQIALNRLMGNRWDEVFSLVIQNKTVNHFEHDTVLAQAQQYSPQLRQFEIQLTQIEGQIAVRRDARKNQLDLVLFAGDRDLRGDLLVSSYMDNEIIGGFRFEFKQSMNRDGVDAELYQAQLQRGLMLQQKTQYLDGLKYDVASLLTELTDSVYTLRAQRASLSVEQDKLSDAEWRYRDGRMDMDQVIAFENQLSNVELALASQELDILRLLKRISIIQGGLWDEVELPAYLSFIKEGAL
ncbi:MAG: TolC family protein [Gammaproteobacteria bacterium]|nr:TolC family protein [Gammaproteobacteria bacterium]